MDNNKQKAVYQPKHLNLQHPNWGHIPGKKTVKDFMITLFAWRFFNVKENDEFILTHLLVADYFKVSDRTASRWLKQLKDIGCLQNVVRPDAGQTGYYKYFNKDTQTTEIKSYTIAEYKKVKISDECAKKQHRSFHNDWGYANVYIFNYKILNDYLIEHISLNLLDNPEQYMSYSDEFVAYLKNRKQINEHIIEIDCENKEETNIASEKTTIAIPNTKSRRTSKIEKAQKQYSKYIDMLNDINKQIPTRFANRYFLDNVCRLTNNLCLTVNPYHPEKYKELGYGNYWRGEHVRIKMLFDFFNINTDLYNNFNITESNYNRKTLNKLSKDDQLKEIRVIDNTLPIVQKFKDSIVEIDINGSIYRLTYNLTHNSILDPDIDIYKLIWDNCHFNTNQSVDWDNDIRPLFKKTLMPIYMREYSIKYKSYKLQDMIEWQKEGSWKFNKVSDIQKDLFIIYQKLTKLLNCTILDYQTILCEAMHKVLNINKFCKADIFIYESNLHILMMKEFFDRNIQTINVYDGFYFKKDDITKELFDSIYLDCINKLKADLNIEKLFNNKKYNILIA